MIIVMKPGQAGRNIQRVVAVLEEHQLQAHLSTGKQVTIIGVVGDKNGFVQYQPGSDGRC